MTTFNFHDCASGTFCKLRFRLQAEPSELADLATRKGVLREQYLEPAASDSAAGAGAA